MMNPFKNVDARVVTTLSINLLDAQGGAYSVIGNGILTKFKFIQSLIVVLLVYKIGEDPFKIESTRVVTTFLPL